MAHLFDLRFLTPWPVVARFAPYFYTDRCSIQKNEGSLGQR